MFLNNNFHLLNNIIDIFTYFFIYIYIFTPFFFTIIFIF